MRVIVEARLLLKPGTEQVLATLRVQHRFCPPSLEVHWRPNQTNAKKVFPNRAKRGTKREENSKRDGTAATRKHVFLSFCVTSRSQVLSLLAKVIEALLPIQGRRSAVHESRQCGGDLRDVHQRSNANLFRVTALQYPDDQPGSALGLSAMISQYFNVRSNPSVSAFWFSSLAAAQPKFSNRRTYRIPHRTVSAMPLEKVPLKFAC